jgi:nucleoside-diphosphate-sugar epimerase
MLCGITGANGFVGSHMVEHLLQQGHQVRVLARPTADLRWIQDTVVEVVQGSVSERDALCRTFDGCDLVFHFAAVTSANVPEQFYRVNRDGTRLAVEACLEAAPRARRFVLMSSIAAVGPGSRGEAIDEATRPHPINHYGRSKLAGEKQARAAGDKLPLTIVRPGAIYGPRDADVLTLLKVATLGFRVHVGLARRELNFCHVSDVAQGTMLAACRDEGLGETFNIGDVTNYQLSEVGQAMARVMGRQSTLPVWLPLSVAYGVGAAGGVVSRLRRARPKLNVDRIRLLTARNWTMDVGKARRRLGFKPEHTLETGLAQTAAWYRKMGWLK